MNRDLVLLCMLGFSHHIDVKVFGGNTALIFVQCGDRIKRQVVLV